MEDIWVDIKDYEGYYQISNIGRVKSLSRLSNARNNNVRVLKERILRPKVNKSGYHALVLYKDLVAKSFLVHRLVSEAFIDNTNEVTDVNHKNGIKTDNRVENLEWVSHLDNMRHAFELGLMKNRSNGKGNMVLDLETNITYNSIKEAWAYQSRYKHNICLSNAIRKGQTDRYKLLDNEPNEK